MITKRLDKSLSQLIKIADKLHSEIVRREDAFNGYADAGYINCPICGVTVHWKLADAAHCFDRDNMGTRYDDLNVWGTCRFCNRIDPDHREKFKAVIKKLIGDCEFECLEERAHSTVKFTTGEMQEMISIFRAKLEKLKSWQKAYY